MDRPEDDALRQLVAERYEALVRAGFLLTGDKGHGEDLVQQSLMRVHQALRRGAQPVSLEAYTRTTMAKLALRWRTTRWRNERPAVPPETPQLDNPDEALLMQTALRSLPRDQRVVLVLRYYEGLSEREISEVLGIAAGTVKSRTSRALAVLRSSQLLAEPEPEENHVGQS